MALNKNKKPKIGVVILNYKSWQDVLGLVDSFARISYVNFQLIVVDNNSPDDSTLKLESFFSNSGPGRSDKKFAGRKVLKWRLSGFNHSLVFIKNNSNDGYAGGNNLGIRWAIRNHSEYVLIINPDTLVSRGFLSYLVDAAQEDFKIGMVGPRILLSDKKTVFSNGGQLSWHKIQGVLKDYGRPASGLKEKAPFATDYVTGTCLLVKRALIEEVGLMRKDYFLYYEDLDWNLEAKRHGWRCVIVPKAIIYHKESSTTKKFSYIYIYYLQRNGLVLGWRHGNLLTKTAVILASIRIFCKQPVKWLVLPSKRFWAAPLMRAVWDFWRGKMGPLDAQ